MLTLTRGCAEPMLPMCQLKVKVTIEGQILNNQISNNQILYIMLCPLCKSYTNWRIFSKLGWNVHLNKRMCRPHVAHVSAQGQGHNWRSNIKQSNIRHYVVSALQVLHLLKDFLQTWLKCSPQQGDVQNPFCPCISPRSRSQLKVKYQTIKY